MRTFVICLLAVGAFAAESTKKITVNKHAKRGLLTGDHGSEQFGEQLVRYTQPGYQRVAQTGPAPTYTSDLAYQAGSLPLENQHQTQPNVAYDSQFGQNLLRQVEQGYDNTAVFQDQQVARGIYGYGGSVSTGSQPNGARFSSHLVNYQAQQVPITRTVQAPLSQQVDVIRSLEITVPTPQPVYETKAYQVTADYPLPVSAQQPVEVQHQTPVPVSVSQSAPIQISHQEPLNIATGYHGSVEDNQNVLIDNAGASYGQPILAGQRINFYGNSVNLGGLEFQAQAGGLAGFEHVNVGSQQYDFGGQETYGDAKGPENTVLTSAYNAVTNQRNVEQPAQVKTSESYEDQSSGYHYDTPAKSFTF